MKLNQEFQWIPSKLFYSISILKSKFSNRAQICLGRVGATDKGISNVTLARLSIQMFFR